MQRSPDSQRRTARLCALALSILLMACSQSRPLSQATPEPTSTPVAAATTEAGSQPQPRMSGVPRFESDGVCAGGNDLCGFVVVPERHANPGGRTIRLAIRVGGRVNRSAPPDPVIYLLGGPGVKLNPSTQQIVGSARINHDVILYEQRGVGKSEPSLDCPERDQQRLNDAVQSPDDAARLEHSRASWAACRDRWTAASVDLAAYNTIESAADIEDIRTVLGYEKLNLVGGSYGTYLAQATVRAYPNSIRSVVLDSVVPLELPAVPIIPSINTDRAMERTFELCAANPACANTYPDLPEMYKRVVAKLAQQPLTVPLGQQYGGSLQMGVRAFAGVLFRDLYSGPAGIPRLILAADKGQGRLFAERMLPVLMFNRGASEAMNLSMVCHSIGSTPDRDWYVTGTGLMTGLPWAPSIWDVACANWPRDPLEPAFRTAVQGDIPTLVIAGELDPVTAPANARHAVRGLTRHTYVEILAEGHVPGLRTNCGQALIAAFLDKPDTPLDTTCVDSQRVSFAVPYAGE